MTDCVFCDFSKIKERTIATIDGINIVITLGQITNGGYILLIPQKHSPCLGSLNKQDLQTFEKVLDTTIELLKEEYGYEICLFEHGIVGQTVGHSHLHLLPARINLTSAVTEDFPNCQFQTIKHFSELADLYQTKKVPYLVWSNTKGQYHICWNPPAIPEYFRIVSAKALKVPERASWKNMDPALDKRLAIQTMDQLYPLFNL